MRLGPDELDWAVAEMLDLWAVADMNQTHPQLIAPEHFLECFEIISREPRPVRREIEALLQRQRKIIRRGHLRPSPSRRISFLAPGGTSPPCEGGPDSGGEDRTSMGVPEGRPCELPPQPLFSFSASAASDTEEGGV